MLDSLNSSTTSANIGKTPSGSTTLANNTKFLNQSSISKDDIHSSMQAISSELKKQANNTKKQQFNDTVKDILNNLQEEDQKFVEFTDKRGRNSILDLDLLKDNPKGMRQKKKKRSSTNNNSVAFDMSQNTDSGSFVTDSNNSFDDKIPKKRKLDFFERNIEFMQKKQYKIDIERNKKREEEKKKITEKPTLSKNTKRIIQERIGKEKPLFMRTQEVLERQNNKKENLKRLYTELEKPEEMKENILVKNLNTQQSSAQVTQWVNQQAIWQKKKEEKVERMKMDMQRLDTEAEELLYRPNINKTSEILVKMKEGDEPKLPAYERLYFEHENKMIRHNKLYHDHVPKFTPITKKTKPNYNVNSRLSFLGVDPAATMSSLRSSPKKQKSKLSSSKALSNSAMENDMGIRDVNNFANNPDTITAGFRTGSVENRTVNKNVTLDFNKGKNWEDMIDSVNNKPSRRKNEQTDFLYKLNVRSASAWDRDKENFIYLNPKFSSIVGKILK